VLFMIYKCLKRGSGSLQQMVIDPAAPYKKELLPPRSFVLKQGAQEVLLTKKDTEETKEATERLSRVDLLKLPCPYKNSLYWKGCKRVDSVQQISHMTPCDRVRCILGGTIRYKTDRD